MWLVRPFRYLFNCTEYILHDVLIIDYHTRLSCFSLFVLVIALLVTTTLSTMLLSIPLHYTMRWWLKALVCSGTALPG
jgi:hypothetical protein